MNDPIFQLKAHYGAILEVYNDRAIIRRKGFLAYFAEGGKIGDTVFFYDRISGVEYQKPGLTEGYMRFVLPGTMQVSHRRKPFVNMNDIRERESDPNAVFFNSWKQALAEQIYDFILKKISESKGATNSPSTLSVADEIRKYKALLDEGIINEDEFLKKKNQLLNS